MNEDTLRLNWLETYRADIEWSQRKGEAAPYAEVNAQEHSWARRRTLRDAIDAARSSPIPRVREIADNDGDDAPSFG